MRIGLTGIYSSAKTLTPVIVGDVVDLPRTEARIIREIWSEAYQITH